MWPCLFFLIPIRFFWSSRLLISPLPIFWSPSSFVFFPSLPSLTVSSSHLPPLPIFWFPSPSSSVSFCFFLFPPFVPHGLILLLFLLCGLCFPHHLFNFFSLPSLTDSPDCPITAAFNCSKQRRQTETETPLFFFLSLVRAEPISYHHGTIASFLFFFFGLSLIGVWTEWWWCE